MLIVGELKAEKGQKIRGYLTVPGTDVKFPATLINGVKEGKIAVITGGTHGGEYPGIEASIRLAKEIMPEDVSGGIVITHPVNTPAFFAKLQYYGPHDGKNLNRMYPGLATGTVSQKIAYFVTSQMFSKADLYMDLHGGDIHEDLIPFVIYPSVGTDAVTKESIALAKATGIKYICGSASENGTIGAAAKMGVPGFLGEIGASGMWCEQEVKDYTTGVRSALAYAGILKGEVIEHPEVTMLGKMVGSISSFDGCWYPSIRKGDMIKAGDKIGEVRDFFGEKLEDVYMPSTGVCLFVASSLAVCKDDPLAAVGTV